jgi:hypothetical protein
VTTPHRKDSSRAKKSLLAALLLGAPRNSVSRQLSSWAPVFSVQHWAYRFPLAYALWHELRNSLLRTAVLHEIGALDGGLDLHRGGESHSRAAEQQVRIEGIRSLQKLRPWASLFDELVYLEGLTAGLEFQRRNCIPKLQVAPRSSPESATLNGERIICQQKGAN